MITVGALRDELFVALVTAYYALPVDGFDGRGKLLAPTLDHEFLDWRHLNYARSQADQHGDADALFIIDVLLSKPAGTRCRLLGHAPCRPDDEWL